MTWNLSSDRPIYAQLVEQIQFSIVSGVYRPGEKLQSVRDMAAEAAVNPNTMQKALAELERSGLVFSQRTSGRYITEDDDMIQKLKKSMAREQISEFLRKMSALGYGKDEIISLMKELPEGAESNDTDSGM